MVDLSVNFAGLELANPVIAASGPATRDYWRIRRCVEAGAAAVVTKSIPTVPAPIPRPRLAVLRNLGMQNIDTFSEYDAERWVREIAKAKELGVPVIASLAAEDPDKLAPLARAVEEAGADMIELNLSCPHALMGKIISTDEGLTGSYVKMVKEEVSIPVMAKLTPNVAEIAPIAVAAEKAGADAVSAIDTVRCLIGVDLERAEPLLPVFGGYSGPGIKPIALRCVAEIALAVKIPVSGVGGIMSWRDAAEMLMLGATTVQLCTAIMWRGYKAITSVVRGLREFMEERGYSSSRELVGRALGKLIPSERFYRMPVKPIKARVDKNLCNGCGICEEVCFYDAARVSGGVAEIVLEACDGCGLCAQLCPRGAISLRVAESSE